MSQIIRSAFMLLTLTCITVEAQNKNRVIVGWKVPLAHILKDDILTKKDLPKMDRPPVESAFFQQSDTLLDLSAVNFPWPKKYTESGPIHDPFKPLDHEREGEPLKPIIDWIVWNERSKMIVASCHALDWILLDEALGINSLPANIHTTMAVTNDNAEIHRMSLVAGSNETESQASSETLSLEVTQIGTPDKTWVDLDLVAKINDGEDNAYQIKSHFTLYDGTEQKVAHWDANGERWELKMTTEFQTFWGGRYADIRWAEIGGKLMNISDMKSLKETKNFINWAEIPENLSTKIFRVPSDLPMRLIGNIKNPIQDFATDPNHPLLGPDSNHLLNLKKFCEENGVPMEHPNSVVVFCPYTSELFVASEDVAIKLIEILFSPRPEHPPLIRLDLQGEGATCSLVSLSGEKASIVRTTGSESNALLNFAPSLGAGWRLASVSLEYQDGSGLFDLVTQKTFALGQPTEIASFTKNGKKHAIIATASLVYDLDDPSE